MLNKKGLKLISYLIFKIDDDVFASESKRVKCVLDFNKLTNTSIIDNYTYIKLGERNVLLIDSCENTFQTNTDRAEKKSLLVLALDDNSTWVGVTVNRLLSVVDIDINQYIDRTFISNKYILNAVRGVFNQDSDIVKILNINTLVDEYCSRYNFWFDKKGMVCN